MKVSIIGIDCATRYQKVGLARADFNHGVDYLKGEVHLPKDLYLAKKEGWIWVKKVDN